jgi:hypothetical protein
LLSLVAFIAVAGSISLAHAVDTNTAPTDTITITNGITSTTHYYHEIVTLTRTVVEK